MATNDLRLIPALDPTPTEEDDQLLDNILHWHRLKIRLFLSGLITNHRVKAFRAGVEWTVKDIMNIDPNEKNTYTVSEIIGFLEKSLADHNKAIAGRGAENGE